MARNSIFCPVCNNGSVVYEDCAELYVHLRKSHHEDSVATTLANYVADPGYYRKSEEEARKSEPSDLVGLKQKVYYLEQSLAALIQSQRVELNVRE